jgi:hypothetical protein
MKFLPVLAIFFAGVLAAPPRHGGDDSYFDACPTIFSLAQCCGANIGDIVGVDCANRK